jgi:4-oxalocrotonate tautomerase
MPMITVEMWQGRTIEQKTQLAQGITEEFVKIGVPRDHVHVIFKDNSKDNWAIGGKMASQLY